MKQNTQSNIQVGVKSFIVDKNGLVLIIKRACFPVSIWELPGGRIGSRETLLNALKREILEEVGIRSIRNPLLLSAQDIFPSNAQGYVVRLTYISRVTSSSVSLSDEHTEYRWVGLSELLKVKNIDPYLKKIIKDRAIMSFIKSYMA